jgi:exosortase
MVTSSTTGKSESGRGENADRSAPRSTGASRRVRRQTSQITWDQIIGLEGWIKIVILSGLIIFIYHIQMDGMIRTWINDGNWQHGFLIPLFSLYFLHQRREKLAQIKPNTNWFGLALIVLSIVGLLYSLYLLRMGYPQLLMFLGTIFGAVLLCCGWRTIRVTWLPILFLFFALPLPRRLYASITIPMRIWASKVAAAALSTVPNLTADAQGAVIVGMYNGQAITLDVAEQCAGMRLMMAFLALGVAMAYLSDRPHWHRVVLVLSTLPIALFCNFLRVTITGFLYVMVSPTFATGGFHTTLGLLMLPVAFFLYWVIAEMLGRIWIDEPVMEQA